MSSSKLSHEWYPTPEPFVSYLFRVLRKVYPDFLDADDPTIFLDPCVGRGDILHAIERNKGNNSIVTLGMDIDPEWGYPVHDATQPFSSAPINRAHWGITNPPFSYSFPIMQNLMNVVSRGMAVYHRCTLKEPLKGHGLGRTWFREYPPTLTLWLPRFAHQRSKTKGHWSTDSATGMWSVWILDAAESLGEMWPDDQLFIDLEEYTPQYRESVDRTMGLTGTESERRTQFIQLAGNV